MDKNTEDAPLSRENFLVRLISLSSLLLHLENGPSASQHIRNVGLRLSEWLNTLYVKNLDQDGLTPEQYGHIIVDIKKRIDGDFYLIEARDDRVVVGNKCCPFGSQVTNSPNLCNITSSVFGGIAAQNFGYGKVVFSQRIANGDPQCAITVYLKPTVEADGQSGIVYTEEDLPHDYVDNTFGLHMVPNPKMYGIGGPPAFIFDLPVMREDILNAVGVGLTVVDTDDNLVMLNGVAERWISHSKPLLDAVKGLARSALRDEAPSSMEIQVVYDRKPAWYELKTFVPAHLPRPQGLFILIRDRTTERMLQEDAIRTERLKSVGVLAASAAHDLRNPLATVYSMLEMSEQQPELFPTLAATMIDEVNRALRIIDDYLDIAREPQLVLEPYSLTDVAAELKEHVSARCDAVGVTLQIAVDDAEIFVDRRRLMDAILNVVSNALEAMPDGGVLRIISETRDDYMTLHITDTGMGIPIENQNRIWELFFTTKTKGTGVGLYSSRRAIEQMNGSIHVTSTPNDGTTFTIIVPKAARKSDGESSRN